MIGAEKLSVISHVATLKAHKQILIDDVHTQEGIYNIIHIKV